MLKEVLVVQRAEERIYVLLLVGAPLDVEPGDRLEQALGPVLSVGLHQLQEAVFVLGPAFGSVTLAGEKPAKEQVVLVVGRHVHDELGLANLGQDLLGVLGS